ncbi:MAG: aminotransferase class V-fold PLP-dependent enzyme [Chloroflexota bacterium]|nr:aminotransferase class V-fold PLP-dependent enzyme [Chloroflexota bacterium]
MTPTTSPTTADLRHRIVGVDQQVPLLDGTQADYVFLDNAASTPALLDVMDALERFIPYYSSVHRGTGFKSRLSTVAYEQAHGIIAEFVGANPVSNTVIFGKNTTEAINKLSFRYPMKSDAVVLTTQMEHHSNDLPWRARANVVHVGLTPEGRLDEEDFDAKLARYEDRIALVAVAGASNVSGFIQPVHRLARKAHQVGARILVDAAQWAPHRQVDMKPDDDPEHLDFVTISAHKMYAPFGTGALIGPKEIFLQGSPEYPGGGTVDIVTLEEVRWAGMPDRDEAGSPNVVGAVAMAAAAQVLMRTGMDAIAAHEQELLTYATQRMLEIPGLKIYGETDPDRLHEKVGVIPFNLEEKSHFLVASILGYEGGIGVRSGCFCAHPYVVHLLQLDMETAGTWRDQLLGGDKSNMPGMIRASFGCYNNTDDVDRLVKALQCIARDDYQGVYQMNRASGEYYPAGFTEPFEDYFILKPTGHS